MQSVVQLRLRFVFLVVIFFSWEEMVLAHVSLTFPPARQLPLDFLNTFWTKQPCGMPKGNIKTSLVAGGSFNATWHLGYAHQGGYRIELLDSNENKILDLTPMRDNDFFQGQTTAQWHLIELPSNSTCRDCTLRLLRQVPEFAPNFQFISCADVDIVSRSVYTETCSGHGYPISGRCTCFAKYWGNRCQYQEECDTDLDCSGHGRCFELGGSALPRKQCFCPQSHFGKFCNRANPRDLPNFLSLDSNSNFLKKHVKVKLDERVNMFFKILLGETEREDQIEFVLVINGTSYGGLGWRPSNIGAICKSWPFNPNALKVEGGGKGVGPSHRILKRESTFTITKAEDYTNSFSRDIPATNFVTSTNSNFNDERRKINYVQGGQSSGHVQYQPQSSGHVQYQPQSFRSNGQIQTVSNAYSSPNRFSQYSQPQTVQTSKNSQNQNSQNYKTQVPLRPQRLKPQTTPAATEQPYRVQNSPPTLSEWTAKDPFTPMDCSDIILGSARGPYHRLRDTYARGRHTPLPDSLWGGRDDLVAATGWETNGMTTLIFRRRMDSSDGPDHPIRGEMQVIWARGQQPGERVSNPDHQLEHGNPTVSHFYTPDEIKYHGLGAQRGSFFLDFDAVRQEFLNGAYSH